MPHPASPLHQPRSPSAPPLPLPALRLPTQRRRHGAAAVCASLAHGVLIVGLLWRGAALFAGGGKGPGPGGGQGTGTGPGSEVGPGTGGEGSYILRADLKGLIVPPDCAPRGRYQLRFWVAADGRVTDVEIDPLPKDPSCRGDFVGRMKAYRFAPARTRDGQPVASIYPVQITR